VGRLLRCQKGPAPLRSGTAIRAAYWPSPRSHCASPLDWMLTGCRSAIRATPGQLEVIELCKREGSTTTLASVVAAYSTQPRPRHRALVPRAITGTSTLARRRERRHGTGHGDHPDGQPDRASNSSRISGPTSPSMAA
jgi:hypothetical protein